MSLTLQSRFTAHQLMAAVAKARIIIKEILSGKPYDEAEAMKVILPEFKDVSIIDALEYTYRLFSMFAWLTLGANSLDDNSSIKDLIEKSGTVEILSKQAGLAHPDD